MHRWPYSFGIEAADRSYDEMDSLLKLSLPWCSRVMLECNLMSDSTAVAHPFSDQIIENPLPRNHSRAFCAIGLGLLRAVSRMSAADAVEKARAIGVHFATRTVFVRDALRC